MALDYEEFMLKQAEWRGEVKASLFSINNDIQEIKQDMKEIKKHNIKRDWKTAYISGGMAMIVVILGFVIKYVGIGGS